MANIDRIEQIPFAQIANTVLRDKRLSYKARGILAFVLSHADGFIVTRDSLIAASDGDGREAVQSGLNELTELGYRIVQKEQQEDGTWRSVTFWCQTPRPQVTEGRVSRPSDNPSVYKNTNEEYKEPHLSLSSNVSSEEAEALLAQELGAQEIEREDSSPQPDATRDDVGEHTRHRAMALEKAQTARPMKLWVTFDPEKAGYKRADFKREFPSLDYDSTLARFIDYYLDAKPRTNWMATYFGYITEADRRARSNEVIETDSMGLPLDARKRRAGDTPEKLAKRLERYKETNAKFAALQEEEDRNGSL